MSPVRIEAAASTTPVMIPKPLEPDRPARVLPVTVPDQRRGVTHPHWRPCSPYRPSPLPARSRFTIAAPTSPHCYP